jgi:putative cardiolipin synthase
VGRTSFLSRVTGSLGDWGRVRHRMHNKLFIADNAWAITGGRNVDNECLTNAPGNYLDIDVLAAGPIMQEMSESFDDYWNSDQAYAGELMWGRSAGEADTSASCSYLPQPNARYSSHPLTSSEARLACSALVLTRVTYDLLNQSPAYEVRLVRNQAGIEWVDKRRAPAQVWDRSPT